MLSRKPSKKKDPLKKPFPKPKGKKIPSKPALVKKLDTVFSKFIRLRDTKQWNFKYGRCISCGRVLPFDKLQCGHYHSRTHMNTRFDERNCNAECVSCNIFSADHLIGYRENLIKKIGEREVELLNVRAHQSKNYTCSELEILIKYYEQEVKKLQNGKE